MLQIKCDNFEQCGMSYEQGAEGWFTLAVLDLSEPSTESQDEAWDKNGTLNGDAPCIHICPVCAKAMGITKD